MDKRLTIKMYYWVCWILCTIVFGALLTAQAIAATPPWTDPGLDSVAGRHLIRELPFNPMSDASYASDPSENPVSPNWPGSLAGYVLTYDSRARYEPRIPFLAPDSNTAIHLESVWRSQGSQQSATANPEPSAEVTEVPLPAAIWLFASALIGFVSFSARRSI
jgi:hypothetical protein